MYIIKDQAPPPNNNYPDVRLSKGDFDQFIFDKGSDVYHDKILKCPCNSHSEQKESLITCVNCRGIGYLVIERIQTKMIVQGLNLETKFSNWSEEKIGMVKISALEESELSYMDRITLLKGETIYNERITLTATKGIYLGRFIYPPTNVLFSYQFQSDKLPLKKLTYLSTNLGDFKINGSFIEMPITNPNIKEVSISIRYKHHPEFLIQELPRDIMNAKNRDNITGIQVDDVSFPLSAIGKRSHIILDGNNYAQNYLIDNT